MKSQDVAILLKIISKNTDNWQIAELANSMKISMSEVSESLNRSKIANLLNSEKKKVSRQNFADFLEYGLKYVFPQETGTLVRGNATAHSHPAFKAKFISEVNYVWENIKGEILGLNIEPLYVRQIEAIEEDEVFYKLLSLVDMLRIGKTREVKFAITELKKIILI